MKIINKLICSIFIGIIVSIMATVYTNTVMADLSDNILRLHIIANSDSDIDQQIKLKVRDEVIGKVRQQIEGTQNISKDDIIKNITYIEEIANSVLIENGFSYNATAYYGTFDFPKKVYDNIVLPQGTYSGVRIVLGNGEGKNWWCVMYPPLCFTENTTGVLSEKGEKTLSNRLNKESYEIINNSEKINIEVKFKIVEAVQNTIKKLA